MLVLEKIAVKLQHHNGVVSVSSISASATAAAAVAGPSTSSGVNAQMGSCSQGNQGPFAPIQYRYSIMAGTSEKMLDYLLETRLDANADLVGG